MQPTDLNPILHLDQSPILPTRTQPGSNIQHSPPQTRPEEGIKIRAVTKDQYPPGDDTSTPGESRGRVGASESTQEDTGVRRARLTILVIVVAASLLGAVPAATAATGWAGNYPTTGDVTIPAGETVVLDTDLNLTSLTIDGIVECGTNAVKIKARWILVNGTFRCGTHDAPFKKRLTVTLTGSGNGNFTYGDKYIVVPNGGRFELHGKRRRSWTTLEETASIGATTITLARAVWKPGDQLVIAPTNYEMDQAEVVTVASRTGNVVTLTEPLAWEHYCGTDKYAGKTITECAEVGLLSHNIVIRGNVQSA